jgi:hypothetical protein
MNRKAVRADISFTVLTGPLGLIISNFIPQLTNLFIGNSEARSI